MRPDAPFAPALPTIATTSPTSPTSPTSAITSTRLFATAALLLIAVILPGCRGTPVIREGRAYPRAVPVVETLDIQVFRHQTEIEFTNTTAQPFGASTIWLNRRFSRPIEGLAVGETMRFPLREFRDRYGDSFRGGGFFAVERPEMLAVAELETAGGENGRVLRGMVVVGAVQ
jgi:hypothetical protein